MCGITGWVSFGRDLSSQQQVLEEMTETMACRGPDASGTWTAPHAVLGNRRLAVIDLPGGTQPMQVHTPDGPVAMVYSGETYNFTEIRTELRGRGHRFETDSDTEVVLRGYLEWGEAVAERLNGMYGFAIWDSRTEKLVMVRDCMGIKPFYYYETADGVLFGSEPKAIFANPLAEAVIGMDSLREMFAFSTKTPGFGLWENMRELRPGHLAVVDRNGLRERAYWKLEVSEHVDDVQTTVQHVRELLDDIIARQLVADVPLCSLLSGGLDSSAITAIAAEQLARHGETVRSFAVDFPDQAANFQSRDLSPSVDTPFAHAVAEHVHSDHSDIVLDGAALADPAVRRTAIAARDWVGFGDRDNSIYLLFKAIRDHSTVALTGEAADELFGGYPWFHNETQRNAETFPWLIASSLNPSGLLDEEVRARLDLDSYVRDNYHSALRETPLKDGETGVEKRLRQVSHMHLTRLVPNLLDRKDRLSMAVGLEVRVPFCDHRLVQYVFNTPWSLKTFDGREKSILRGATRNMLPASVADREKSGYPGTFDPGYLSAIQDQVNELLTSNHTALNFFDHDKVRAATAASAATISADQRSGIERILDMATLIDLRDPVIKFG